MNKDDLLNMIPIFHSGEREGQPRNEGFRAIQRMLMQYNFNEKELKILQDEINCLCTKENHDA